MKNKVTKIEITIEAGSSEHYVVFMKAEKIKKLLKDKQPVGEFLKDIVSWGLEI